MRPSRAVTAGFGLVEVLVATAVVALNLLGWTATLHVVLTLTRRITELGAEGDPDVVASALCALSILVPPTRVTRRLARRTAPPTHRRPPLTPRAGRRAEGGLSLVEVLVALGVGTLLLAGLAATMASTSRVIRGAGTLADAAVIRASLPALVADVVTTAGRGMDDACGLVAWEGAHELSVRRAGADGTVLEEEVFAALDGGGRPALYLRRRPHARQPWVEDVTSFRVDRIDHVTEPGSPPRATIVALSVAHGALGERLAFEVALPHRPCVETAP